MTFDNSIKTCLRKSFTFEGRASRSEYWYFILFILLFLVVGGLFIVAMGLESDYSVKIVFGILLLGYICCVPASVSVMVRRFHDVNRSGWNFWWGAIPYIGGLIVLYFMVQPSSNDENEYGLMPN